MENTEEMPDWAKELILRLEDINKILTNNAAYREAKEREAIERRMNPNRKPDFNAFQQRLKDRGIITND